jgi:hypothetical protein
MAENDRVEQPRLRFRREHLIFLPGPLREFKISHGKIPDLRPRGAFQCRPTDNSLCKNVNIDAMFDN